MPRFRPLISRFCLLLMLGTSSVIASDAAEGRAAPASDLIAQLTDGESAADREAAARALLARDDLVIREQIVAMLRAGAPEALPLARVLAADPYQLSDELIAALPAALAADAPALRRAAVLALARDPAKGGVERLRNFINDAHTTRQQRIETATILAAVPTRAVAHLLVELLEADSAALRRTALASLEAVSVRNFEGDYDQARQWWQAVSDLTAAQWSTLHAQRLAERNKHQRSAIAALEDRLALALRVGYQQTPAADRPLYVRTLLADPLATVRRIGLELLVSTIAEGSAIEPATSDIIHELLRDEAPAVRAAAARTIAAQRRPADAPLLVEQLRTEPALEVRLALVSGLGYLGEKQAAPPILELIRGDEAEILAEALTALGRLVERDQLTTAQRVDAVAILPQVYAGLPHHETLLRQRALAAMARFAEPTFYDVFAKAAQGANESGLQEAALRGLMSLDQPQAIDVAAALLGTEDPVVRRMAIELFGRWAAADRHLLLLLSRLAPETEPREELRAAAWETAIAILQDRSPTQRERWLNHLPKTPRENQLRRATLLKLIADDLPAETPLEQTAEINLRLAALLVRLNDQPGAVSAYFNAVNRLHADQPEQAAAIAAQLIASALIEDVYDEELAARLRELNPALPEAVVWEHLAPRLTAAVSAAPGAGKLSLLRTAPPVTWSEATLQSIAELEARATRREQPPDAE